MLRRSLALAAFALLAACMLVNDFGPAWNQAKPDPCISKIAESLYYTEFRRDPADKKMDDHAHALKRTNGNYLMFKQNVDDKGGRMYRFEVRNGIFQRLRLVPTMRATFEKNYPDAPVKIVNDTIQFDVLGEKEWALIDEISAQSDYWEIEDQTLYNILRNPACTFDDRNLSTFDETGVQTEKPKKTK
jgi:hypothetical protein